MKKFVVLRRVVVGELMVGFSPATVINARTTDQALEVAKRKGHLAPVVQDKDGWDSQRPAPLMHKNGTNWHRTTQPRNMQ